MGHYRSYLPSAAQQMLTGKINKTTWKILKYTSNHNPQTAFSDFHISPYFLPDSFCKVPQIRQQTLPTISVFSSHYTFRVHIAHSEL